MKSLELTTISKSAVEELRDSFDRLPDTDHKDGKFRLRRYSVIVLRTSFWNAKQEAEIEHLPVKDFTQSEDYNKHQGGMKRSFENLGLGLLLAILFAFLIITPLYKLKQSSSSSRFMCINSPTLFVATHVVSRASFNL